MCLHTLRISTLRAKTRRGHLLRKPVNFSSCSLEQDYSLPMEGEGRTQILSNTPWILRSEP